MIEIFCMFVYPFAASANDIDSVMHIKVINGMLAGCWFNVDMDIYMRLKVDTIYNKPMCIPGETKSSLNIIMFLIYLKFRRVK